TPAASATPMKVPTSVAVDGPISAVDCAHTPEITITLALSKGPMVLHIADFRRIMASAPDEQSLPKLEGCQQWTRRRVKVWFRIVQGQEYLGEITNIYFF